MAHSEVGVEGGELPERDVEVEVGDVMGGVKERSEPMTKDVGGVGGVAEG